MIFDTHAHYDDEAFDTDREELLSSLSKTEVAYVVDVASSLESLSVIKELITRWPFLYGTAGVHPSDSKPLNEDTFTRVKEFARHPKVKAIGEIGLDYHWDDPERDWQKKWFDRQLLLAKEMHLPVVIHSRDAAKDTLDMMRSENARGLSGIMHCFSYGVEMAREYLSMGYYLGIGGVLTFKNAKKLKEAAGYAPLSQLVIETDSPYLAPVPYRGKRNQSSYLPFVVKALAEIKQVSEEEVERITFANAVKVYQLEDEIKLP